VRLGIYVPAFGSGLEDWEPLIGRLRDDPAADLEWEGWDHGLSAVSRRRSLVGEAARLRSFIDDKWRKHAYTGLVLVGHGAGGLLIRQAYLSGCTGAADRAHPSEWAARVDRIVLFAAPNRGLHLDRVNSGHPVYQVSRVLQLHRLRWLYGWSVTGSLLKGSRFIADLRIKWIRYFRQTPDASLPEVVQLRGSADPVVEDEDSLDLGQFSKLYQYTVSEAHHWNVYDPRVDVHDEAARYTFLRDVIGGPLPPGHAPSPPPGRRRVVFILHGIRASSKTWAERAERAIRAHDPETEPYRPPYGWISPIGFAFPPWRRRHLDWFQDMYAEAVARHPEADARTEVHFLGHSHGTYILGHALRQLSGVRFGRVVLAGSVLAQDFPWRDHLKREQISAVRNHCASRDWAVGFFCSWLRGLGMRDVGTAGHRGFRGLADGRVYDVAYHRGGHSSALGDESLATMTAFLLRGEDARPAGLVPEEALPPWFDRLSRAAGQGFGAWTGLVLAAGLLWGAGWLLAQAGCPVPILCAAAGGLLLIAAFAQSVL